jgi:hypothetical protein
LRLMEGSRQPLDEETRLRQGAIDNQHGRVVTMTR